MPKSNQIFLFHTNHKSKQCKKKNMNIGPVLGMIIFIPGRVQPSHIWPILFRAHPSLNCSFGSLPVCKIFLICFNNSCM